jgi:hypothetical protein
MNSNTNTTQLENKIKCECCNTINHQYNPLKGYYIIKLLPELQEIIDKYDILMQNDIEEVKKEKNKSKYNHPYFDMEIEKIKSDYSQLKNAISIGYFIKTT